MKVRVGGYLCKRLDCTGLFQISFETLKKQKKEGVGKSNSDTRPDQKKKLVNGFRAPYFRKWKFIFFLKKKLSMDFARLIFFKIENFYFFLNFFSSNSHTSTSKFLCWGNFCQRLGKKKKIVARSIFSTSKIH